LSAIVRKIDFDTEQVYLS